MVMTRQELGSCSTFIKLKLYSSKMAGVKLYGVGQNIELDVGVISWTRKIGRNCDSANEESCFIRNTECKNVTRIPRHISDFIKQKGTTRWSFETRVVSF